MTLRLTFRKRKEILENLKLTEHFEVTRNRGKQRLTEVTIMYFVGGVSIGRNSENTNFTKS